MANKRGKAKEAALQFFKTANPQDEFFLVGFNERAQLLSPFTPNVEDLQSRMLAASAKGKTALLDAIYLGLSQMPEHVVGLPGGGVEQREQRIADELHDGAAVVQHGRHGDRVVTGSAWSRSPRARPARRTW